MGTKKLRGRHTSRKLNRSRQLKQDNAARRNRSLQIEQCEHRLLLSVSPTALQLVSISPYETSILGTTPPTNTLIYGPGIGNTVRTQAPTELVLDFNQGQNIDAATLSAIQVFRSGGDNQFQTTYNSTTNTYTANPNNTAMDVPVPIGSATINQTLNTTTNKLSSNEVVIRFTQDLPADLYQIVIVGKANSILDDRPAAKQVPLGATSSASAVDQAFNGGQDQVIDFTLELGAHVTSVVPQPIARNGNGSLSQARNEVDVYFDQQLNQASAQDPSLYQLIVTANTANSADDIVVAQSHYTVQYSWNAATGVSESRLIFDADLSSYDPSLSARSGTSSFRLRVGTQYHQFGTDAATVTTPANYDETFGTAKLVGTVENPVDLANKTGPVSGETLVVDGKIQPQTYNLEWPGGTDTPGNRNLPANVGVDGESHFDGLGPADPSASSQATIPTILYNFADAYNINDPTEHNGITAAQEDLARDIFQLYGNYLGVKFQETYAAAPTVGEITVATGDLAALGGVSGPGGVIGMGGTAPNGALEAVMDGAENWGYNNYGGSWFATAIHEIGHTLGYGHDDEIPELSMMNVSNDPTANLTQPENVLPSPEDVATGQYMYRTDSSAIDLYQFSLPTAGTLSLETIAQRMQNSSTLNTNLILYNSYYDSQGNVQHQVIARNDDYFGTDSYINAVNLPAGVYYVGVSSSGNDNYNPNVPLSGMNGTSQGAYELRIGFAPSPAAPASVLTDGNISLDNSASVTVTFKAGTAPLAAGTDNGHQAIISSITSVSSLDGKTFQVSKGSNVYTFEFVDASNPSRQAQPGHLALSFNSQTDGVNSVLQGIAGGINNVVSNLVNTTATPLDGDNDGKPGGLYDFWFNVQDSAHTLYVDKSASAVGADGSLAHPYTTVQAGLSAAAQPAVLLTDGNITIDNSSVVFAFAAGTSPFSAFSDNGHAAISGINSTTLPNQAAMAALNGEVFHLKRINTGIDTIFEFVDVSKGGSAAAGHQAVYYNSTYDMAISLQTIITNAINGALQPGEILRIVGNDPLAAGPAAALTDGNVSLDNATGVSVGPAKVLSDGNIALDNAPGVSATFTPGTAPFTASTDSGHPVIANITTTTNLDGKTFQINNGTNVYTFEFVDTSNPLRKAAAGHLALSFNSQTDTTLNAVIQKKIANAINSVLWVTFPAQTQGSAAFFSAGTDNGHPVITGITSSSVAALDGKTFQVANSTTVYVFEFVDASNPTRKAAAGHLAVSFNSQIDNIGAIVQDVANAINNAVSNNDYGANTIIAVPANSSTSVPLIKDGETFTISEGQQVLVSYPGQAGAMVSNGSRTMTFEFTRSGTLTDGNIPVKIKPTDTAAQVATDIANAINSVSVSTTKVANGLYATATVSMDPTTGLFDIVSVTGSSVTVNLGNLLQSNHLKSSLQLDSPYEIGTDPLNNVLADGATMSVPKGCTLMIDSGAVFKLMGENIDVGSSAVDIDRSLGAIQVLGTPSQDVYFTSWNDQRVGNDFYKNSQGPGSGDWGGIVFRNDYDYQEQVADPTRRIMEQQGIFLDYVNHANMMYGGGQVTVNGIKDYYDPIYLVQARPAIGYNTITYSQHAAVSADPNSFQESLFHDTFGEAMFTADYDRAGPSIYGNLFTIDNYNGVFIRVTTNAGSSQEQLTTDARLSSTDAVYVLAETLTIAGNPGGAVANIYSKGSPVGLGDTATTNLSSTQSAPGDYQLSVPINPLVTPTLDPNVAGTAATPATLVTDFEWFALSNGYRTVRFEFDYTGHGASDGSDLIAVSPTGTSADLARAIAAAISSSGLGITATVTIVSPVGTAPGAAYINITSSPNLGYRIVVKGLTEAEARMSGRLDIDPGVIVKLSAARIESQIAGQLLAEGTIDRPIIFTSLLDQTYGAGGTFDTKNENATANPLYATAGDWSGLYFSPTAFGSLDFTRMYYAGGTSAIEGGFASFAPVEIRQADVRITNSVFESNESVAAVGNDRNGRGDLPDATGVGDNTEAAVIQVRGAQPILVNDVILNNAADAISFDCNSLSSFQVQDWGRSTGLDGDYATGAYKQTDLFVQYADNVGPMVRQIKMSNNDINGMVVRPGTMNTEGIWDDTDIVHVVEGPIVVPNVTIYGGLRLESNSQASLVVKFLTPVRADGTPINPATPAEILATGTPLEIQGRIGGALQVMGTPGHPVVLTSLNDNSVGAYFDPWGNPQYLTGNNSVAVPKPGDWNSLILDTYSNDYNVAVINEYEPAFGSTSDLNGTPNTAQFLGQLAQAPTAGDDTLRLGFEVHGAIDYNNPGDKDVYSFQGFAGTQVWLNIDRTTYALDSQLDLLDANGNVLATAYASIDPGTGNEIVPQFIATGQFAAAMDPNLLPPGNNNTTWTPGALVNSTSDPWYVNNMYSTNPNDAAMRVVLPGPAGQQRTYYVRVSSHSGKSSGNYELQIRLQSTRVTPGSVVRYADIRYATNGVQVIGKPDHSPLEVQSFNYTNFNPANQTTPPATAQPIGNLAASDENTLNVGGFLNSYQDVNWYSFTVGYNYQTGDSTVEIPGESRFPVTFDVSYASGLARPDTVLWIFDSTGKLVLRSTGGSQIVDQQTEPLQGANSGNLLHASYGSGDAYIGPVYLPANVGGGGPTTYYVAVTTLGAVSNSASGPLVRYETIDSINQVADDNIGSQNANLLNQAPTTVLFPGTSAAQLNTAAQPFNLGDVPLYVLTTDHLFTSNPYTGALETQVTESIPGLPYSNPLSYNNGTPPDAAYGDIAMRNDGRLYAITSGPRVGVPPIDQNLWSGTLVQLDTGDASNQPVTTQANGLITYRPQGTGLDIAGEDKGEEGGIHMNAIAYGPDIGIPVVNDPATGLGTASRSLIEVGNYERTDNSQAPADQAPYTDNLVYLANQDGIVYDPPVNHDDSPRLPTQVLPVGQLLTGGTITVPDENSETAAPNSLLDGTRFTITSQATATKPATTLTFEMDSGPDVDLGRGALAARDGMEFQLSDGVNTKTFMLQSGPVLLFPNSAPLGQVGNLNHTTFTLTDDKEAPFTFEFTYDGTVGAGNTAIDLSGFAKNGRNGSASAKDVAQAAIKVITGSGDLVAALGDESSFGSPANNSVWARVSLIHDSVNTSPSAGSALLAVEGTYKKPADPNTVVIPFEETYNTQSFLNIETVAPQGVPTAADIQRGYPWANDFGAQIANYVQAALPRLRVGYAPAYGPNNARITFYNAVNEKFAPAQSTGLVSDATSPGGGLANNDFTITAVNTGDQYNNVQVNIFSDPSLAGQGDKAFAVFAPGQNGVGGVLTIHVNTGFTTANTVVTAINATNLFTAALSAASEANKTNTGKGLVELTGIVTALNGGLNQGVLSWTDPTPGLPAIDVQSEAPVWTHRQGTAHYGVNYLSETGFQDTKSAQETVPFTAGDNAELLAKEIAAAINKATVDFPNFTVSAVASGIQVNLTNASVTVASTADPPLSVAGQGPGGNVTGLAWLNGHLLAVSDQGGVYEAMNPYSPEFMTKPDIGNPNAPKTIPDEIQPIPGGQGQFSPRFIGQIMSDTNPSQGARFAGLTLGPQDVENGAYANMLFAVTTDGRMYAISFNGNYMTVSKQPIFLNGATSLSLGINETVTGLAFTTLDYNLWHVTNQKGGDPGHGTNQTYDSLRMSGANTSAGGTSFYFGLEDPRANTTISVQPHAADYEYTNPAVYNTYNLPDGAAGSLQTQTFDLTNYTAADAPTLYFNYFLAKGGPTDVPHDSARVYASADGANWTELADLADSGGSWLQGVYNLGGFAGKANVRVRFDFSTAADMEIGDANGTANFGVDVLRNPTTGAPSAMYGGAYMTALSGNQINDGDTFIVDGQTFAFDMGKALIVPNVAGDSIKAGDSFTVMARNATGTLVALQKFEFTTTGKLPTGDTATPISIYLGETTDLVALAIAQAVNGANLTNSLGNAIYADVYQSRVMLDYAEGLTVSAGSLMTTKGAGFGYAFVNNVATTLSATNIVPVRITSDMSANAVALAIATSMDQVYSAGRTLQAVTAVPPVTDGESFTLLDNQSKSVQFILNQNGGVNTATVRYIQYSPKTDTANLLTQKIAAAIVASGLNMTVSINGSVITLTNLVQFTNGGSPITNTGNTLNVVSAVQLINANDSFTLTGNTLQPVTFVFGPAGTVLTGRQQLVAYQPTDNAGTIAVDIANAITAANTAFGLNITATPNAATGTVVLSGPLVLYDPGTSQIQLTGIQADSAPTLAANAANGQFTNMKVVNSLLHVIGHTATDAVSNTVGGTATLPISDFLNGDLPTNRPPYYDRYLDKERGQDNNHAGWYVDDVQIGFAERGQMVTASAPNTTFTFFNPGGTTSGYYQLQIRRGPDYGTWPLPTNPPTMGLLHSYDANDRLSNSLTLTVPSANELSHGATFTLSDGVNSGKTPVTFEYLGTGIYDAANNPNYQPIYFTANQTPAQIAAATAAAINLANTRGLFSVEATANGNSNQVYLFQAANITYGGSWAEAQPEPVPADLKSAAKNVTANNPSPATYFGTTIVAPAGQYITNGQAFTISDGVNTILVHLHDRSQPVPVFSSATVLPNFDEVLVNYNATDTAATVAQAIAAKINALNMTINLATGLPYIQVAAVITKPTNHINLTLSPGPLAATTILASQEVTTGGIAVDGQAVQYVHQGDVTNLVDQGEDIIEEAKITYSAQYGIAVTSVQPTPAGNGAALPAPLGNDPSSHPYSVGPLRVANTNRLVPGITIVNNVLAYGGSGGILFSGDPSVNGQTQAAVPFGHIINNTIYGGVQQTSQTVSGSTFTKLTGTTGAAKPATTTVYRLDLASTGMTSISSLTIADNSGSVAGGPAGQFSGLNLDGLLVSSTSTATAAAAAGLTGQSVFDFNAGVALQPGTQNAPVSPSLFGTNNGNLNDTVATLEAFDASGPSSATPVGFVALGVGGTITFYLTKPITVVPGTYLYIAVSEDKGQFAAAKITAAGQGNSGTGILVQNNASPTILNNIVSTLGTGIQVVTAPGDLSNTTVVGYSVYQNNGTNSNLPANSDTDAIYAAANQQLFVNPAVGNFYPSQFSPVIDSSVNQLDDRPAMVTVRQPLGIPSSPMLAPNYDLYGQLRISDPQVSPYPGLGSNVYKDRGAVDRVDFAGPTTLLLTPQDNDAAGLDIDPRVTWVTTTQQETQFAVQLVDNGSGVDDSTVTSATVVLTEDPDNNPSDIKTLVAGTDYFFQYDSTNHVIHLIPAAGVWAEGYTYNIALSTAIQDLAGNPLQPNRLDNSNQFTIVLAGPNGSNSVPAAGIDFSHAPSPYPVAWHVVPTNPTLWLGDKNSAPMTLPAYVASETRSDNGSISSTNFVFAQGTQVTIPVTVTDTGTAPAYLNVWIDFYRDSTFADQGDQVATDLLVAPLAQIASATESGNSVTITTTSPHSFTVGEQVNIAGVGAAGYNGTFTITSVASPTTFTYTDSATGLAASSGGTASVTMVPVSFTVPAGLDPARFQTWIRLRLSTQQALTYSGGMPGNDTVASATAEPDGEVEDFHNVLVVPPPVSVTGTVYSDVNSNGQLDTGESGLAGWTVFLDAAGTGQFDATKDPYTVTDQNGSYTLPVSFANPNITAGTSYYLYEMAPAGAPPFTHTQPAASPYGYNLPVSAGLDYSAENFGNHLPPLVTSIVPEVPPDRNPTNATIVHFVVNFSSPVTGVEAKDFKIDVLSGSILPGMTLAISPTAGPSSTYIVTVSGVSGNGMLAIQLVDQGIPIQDQGSLGLYGPGSSAASPFTSQSFTIDQIAPTLVSFVVTSPNPTNSTTTATFQLTFSEAMAAVAPADFTFDPTGTTGITGSKIAGVSVDSTNKIYTVTVNLGTGSSGTVQLDLNSSSTSPFSLVTDLAGNALVGAKFVGPKLTIDRVQPTVSIAPATGQANPATVGPIKFTVTFSKPVTGLTVAAVDLSLSSLPNLTATLAPVNLVNGFASTYTVTVTGMVGSGTVVARIKAGAASDAAGNLNVQSGTATVTFTSQPTVTVVQPATQKLASAATNVAPVTFTVTFNQPVVDFTAAKLSYVGSTAPGKLVGTISGSGPVYTVSVSGMTGTGRVQLSIPANMVHNAAGTGNVASTGTANYIFYDITPPTETVNSPAAGSIIADTAINAQGYLVMAYSAQVGVGENTATITDAAPEFTLSGAAAAGVVVNGAGVSIGGDLFKYTFTGKFTAGLVTVNFIANSFQDNAGNYNKAGTSSFTVSTVRSISVANVSVTKPASGSVNAVFTLTLSAASTTAVSVHFATANGSNTVAGSDYTGESGMVTFPAGTTTKTISVPVLAKGSATFPKTFLLNLSAPSGAVLGQASATCTINKAAAPKAALSASAVLSSTTTVSAGPQLPTNTVAAVAATVTSPKPAAAAVLSSPAPVTAGPQLPTSMVAAVAATLTTSSSSQKQATTAVDAVFARLMNQFKL